jgi:hypothetical protein
MQTGEILGPLKTKETQEVEAISKDHDFDFRHAKTGEMC